MSALLGGGGQRQALLALPRRLQNVVRAHLRPQLQYLLFDALLACDRLLYQSAPAWRRQAVAGRSYNSAFALSEAAMRMGLAQLQLVDAAAGLPRSEEAAVLRGASLSFKVLDDMREAVIQQVWGAGVVWCGVVYWGRAAYAECVQIRTNSPAVGSLALSARCELLTS